MDEDSTPTLVDSQQAIHHLTASNLSTAQSQQVLTSLSQLIHHHIQQHTLNHVTRSQLNQTHHTLQTILLTTKTDLLVHQRSELGQLRARRNRIDVDSIKQRVSDSVTQLKTEISIDMNTRKVEVREEVRARTAYGQRLDNLLDTRVAHMRTTIEMLRWEAIKNGLVLVFSVSFALLAVGYGVSRGKKKDELFM
jgi:hypothetical protein